MGPILLPGARLVWLAPQAECEAFRKIFPGTPRSLLEVDLHTQLETMRAELAAELWRPMRYIECVGQTRRRGWLWLDALGGHHGVEWIDASPQHFRDTPHEWPKYPKPTTPADRQQMAA